MLQHFFENSYFLQALGWGIVNSFWQAALLWYLYQIIELTIPTVSTNFRYTLSVGMLLIASSWFIVTIYEGYQFFNNSGNSLYSLINIKWQAAFQKLGNLFQYISAGYLLILLYRGMLLVGRYQSLRNLKNSKRFKASVDTRIFVNHTAIHMGIHKKVTVWISESIDVPCVVGFLKPLILLPFTVVNQLNTEQMEAVLLHELAHIKRNDFLINLLQSLIETLMFFNPFVLLLSKAAQKERENCCDDWVLNYQYNHHAYATALMILEKQRQLPLKLALAATSGEKLLLIRIKRLFNPQRPTRISKIEKFSLGVIGVIACLSIGTILPDFQKDPSSPQASSKNTTTIPYISISNNATVGSEWMAFHRIISNRRILPAPAIARKISTPKAKIKLPVDKVTEYAQTLINAELINNHQALLNIPSQVSVNEEMPGSHYLIKIEEERAGSKEKKSIILEYKTVNGQPELKPLILVNKIKVLPEKVKKNIQPKSTRKKRITT